MAQALTELASDLGARGTLVVASHGLAARAGICRLLDLPPHMWKLLGSLDNCAWANLHWHRHGGYYRLADYNVGGPCT